MTPECYLTFIMDATITGIEKVVKDEITTSIEKALKTKIHLPPTLTIYETELRKNRRIIRGLYNPNTNELILNKGHWCRKTLIHETLHAASYFSQEEYERLNEKIRILIEGMTEFLQGYIMYKEYPECYKAWINQKYPICSLPITYEPATQAFAALARHVPIREITKLYIWQPNTNWHTQYKKFLNKYNIEDVILTKKAKIKINITYTFINALTKTFGNEIKELIYQAPTETCLNYSEMKE
ncbi:MAG: hypothetical protein J7J30_02265 [Candidatus Odinarchaeota archaeon]|nr:hypothetical protein [Candidatus Odinarchaeota archaeon]